MFMLGSRRKQRFAFIHFYILINELVNHDVYISGSQPFPTRGPLYKFCLGSRTTKKFLHFLGKISEFLNDLLKSFSLKMYSPFADHQKEFRQFSQFPLHFSGSRTEKIFKFSFAM